MLVVSYQNQPSMKPINSLCDLVLAPTLSDESKRVARDAMREDRRTARKSSNQMSSSPTNPSPESGSSSEMITDLSASPSQATTDNSNKTDSKKLIGSRVTTMSVLKVSPLSMFANNKVGSSYQRDALMSYRQQQQQQQQMNAANLVLPVSGRKVRDSGSLLFMIAFLSFLGYIIWDGLVVKETDINLIVHGHDSYGNICGRNNRPIRFVDKSGKNFTGKPFTKYTLINSQFERYTLAHDRAKNGELLYVKHEELVFDKSLQGGKTGPKLRTPKKLARNVRAAEPLEHNLLLRGTNQTLLNNLKSKLMYRYPPLYGYNPSTTAATTRAPLTYTNTDKPPMSASARQGAYYGYGHEGGVPTADDGATQLETSASQTNTRIVSASSLSTQPTLGNRVITSTTPSHSMVVFDDHVNDSEHYEHMLIPPANINTVRHRTPDVLNQNEVSSQLLYLTECVDYCPQDHVELIFFRCMPKNWRFSLFPNAINVTRTFIDDILTDMSHCYRELIYIFSLALVLSIALLILLRFLASIIIWSCLCLLIVLVLTMAGYSWVSYYYQILDLNQMMPHDSVYAERIGSSDKWLVGSIFLTFVAFAIIGTVVFMRKRILLVTMLFRESGKAIADMPLLLLQPLLTFAALLVITIVWSLGLICLQSMKIPIIDMSTGFVVFKAEALYKIMKWYHVFAFLWVSHFAIACQHYVIGAAVSKWYFSTNRYNLHSPIGSSIAELVLYYLGSVALGSFLVAIFKVIRIIVRQIQFLVQRNCMNANNPSSAVTTSNSGPAGSQLQTSFCGSFFYVWRLFIWFFDNIVMVINRDAYVEIAIHGHSFLAGAKQAFNVLASNPLRLLAIKSVSNVLLMVAKICVVFGTVSMAMILLEEKSNELNYSWSPVVISAIYAYIVAHWFLSVYEMVIDALFICYCEDYERSKNREAFNGQIVGSNFMSQILNNGHVY